MGLLHKAQKELWFYDLFLFYNPCLQLDISLLNFYCSFLHPRIILRLGSCESSICLDTKTNQKSQDFIKKPTLYTFPLNKTILFILCYLMIMYSWIFDFASLKQAFCSLRVKTFIALRLFYNVVFQIHVTTLFSF